MEFDPEKEQTEAETAARNRATEEALAQAIARQQNESAAAKAQREAVLREQARRSEVAAAGGAERLLQTEKATRLLADTIQDVLIKFPMLQKEDIEPIVQAARQQIDEQEKRMSMNG